LEVVGGAELRGRKEPKEKFHNFYATSISILSRKSNPLS